MTASRSAGEVVDASVAIKWVLQEAHSAEARALYADSAAAHRLLQAPPHFAAEVVNGLYRRIQRRGSQSLTYDEAHGAVTHFLRLPVQLVTLPNLYYDAFMFAHEYTLPTVYDSIYAITAQRLGVDFWTADQRMLNALGAVVPWVRSIADYRV